MVHMARVEETNLPLQLESLKLNDDVEQRRPSPASVNENPDQLYSATANSYSLQQFSGSSTDSDESSTQWKRKNSFTRTRPAASAAPPVYKKSRAQHARSSLNTLRSYHSDTSEVTTDCSAAERSSEGKLVEFEMAKTTPQKPKKTLRVFLSKKKEPVDWTPPSSPKAGCMPFKLFWRKR